MDIGSSFLLRSSTSSFFIRSDQLTSPSFSSTTIHKFHSTSDPFSELSKFQYHKKLCSKCSISLRISSRLNRLAMGLKNCSSPSSDITVDTTDAAGLPVVHRSSGILYKCVLPAVSFDSVTSFKSLSGHRISRYLIVDFLRASVQTL